MTDTRRKPILGATLVVVAMFLSAPGGSSIAPSIAPGGDPVEALRASLSQHPGFLALAPAKDGSGTLYAFFEGEAPDVATPGLDVQYLEGAEPRRMMLELDETLEELQQRSTGPANPIDFNFGRPGSPILINFNGVSGTFICTLSFFFKDKDTGRYYASTAGHCLLPSTKHATHGPGADWDPADTNVRVCINACYFGGQLTSLNGFVSLGNVKYARQVSNSPFLPGDIGNDFGLVEIHPSIYTPPFDWVTPTMATWQGPSGKDDVEGSDVLVHFGNGIDGGTFITSKARAGVGLNDGAIWKWQAALEINGGDSGSPISHLNPVTANGGDALGVITHGIGVAGVGIPGLGFGTTISRGQGMALSDAGIDIELVLDGSDLNIPPKASFTKSCTGLSCTFDASGSSDADGTVTDYEWDFGDGNTASVTSASTSHTYSSSGSYTVKLVVIDDDGALSDEEDAVATVTNLNPTASYTFSCTGLDCNFDASGSSDSDGTISTYAWDFGDSNSGSGATPSHTYGSAGTYSVKLTVTDNAGGTDDDTQSVTV